MAYRRPKRHPPPYPPWDRIECDLCAAPVRKVWLTSTDVVLVGMKPAPGNDRRATVAAHPMDNRLNGRMLGPNQRPEEHESVWILHEDVCPEIPRPQQLALPTDQECT